MRKAIGYASEAVRLLWKHPSLALVALAMGVLWQVDARVGNYIARQHTGWGRDNRRWAASKPRLRQDDPRAERLREIQASITRLFRHSYIGMLTPPRPPEVDLTGAISVVSALTYGNSGRPASGKHPPYFAHDAVASPLVLSLTWLTGAITVTGYLWVAWLAVTTDRARWREFLAPGWSVWWRVGVFNSAVLGSGLGVMGLASLHARLVTLGAVLLNVLTALLFLLVLTPFAIVSMRTGIVRAMRMSVRLVATSLPTALVLVLATSVLSSLAFKFAPMGRVGALLAQSGDAMVVERQLQSLAGLPLDALAAGVLGVILAWYVAAMMLWCSDVHRAGVPEPPENPALC